MGACLLFLLFACNDADKAGVDTGLTSAGLTDTSSGGDGGDGGGEGADTDCETRTWYYDEDGDGWGDEDNSVESCEHVEGAGYTYGDCDDSDPDVHPDATEVCDGIDNDCNGDADGDDAADPSTFYVDDDADGHGDPDNTVESCSQPSDAVSEADADDCDDTDGGVYPGATERCDGVDEDCDGEVDEDAVDMTTWFSDGDGDGYGLSGTGTDACEAPSGHVDDETDCDDDDSAVNPGAAEVCNEIDDDCDGLVDDEDTVTAPRSWYDDADSDGYGDATTYVGACDQPFGTVSDATDCDDTDADVNPAADEICNEIDDDCDGLIDDDDTSLTGATTWYTDSDGDGYDDSSTGVTSCAQPSGTVELDGDCEDADAESSPDTEEICDGIDNDCDGDTDEGDAAPSTWYADLDGDGSGDAGSSIEACEEPSMYVSNDDDCDDADPGSSADGTEICDGLDNDCDGTADEDATDMTTWYADLDGDGWGDETDSVEACEQPSQYVSNAADCDDMDSSVGSGGTEICDGVDNDCDGTVDGGDATDAATWYEDADGDGYGAGHTGFADCDPGSGYTTSDGDCDDGSADVNPDVDEICNGIDDDCDGLVDADDASVTDADIYFDDADGDGWGDDSTATTSCEELSGMVTAANDCDDTDADTNPAADETCDDEDDDCDGDIDENAIDVLTWYADLDGDGEGDPGNLAWACDQPSGYQADGFDCDDTDPAAFPGADEYCDGKDDDCDALIDEDSVDALTVYEDADGDGYGLTSSTSEACEEGDGWSFTDGDCDDEDAANSPGGTEICDEQDNDCDGLVDDDDSSLVDATLWYEDADGDGYGHASSSLAQCEEPSGYLDDDSDCDDTSADRFPGAEELCNSVDDDCDNVTDEDACIDVSNVDASYFAYATGDLEISSDTTFDTNTGVIDGIRGKGDNEIDGIWYDLIYQEDGTTVALLAVASLDISATLTVEGDWPLVIFVDGDADISGEIDGKGDDGEDALETSTGTYAAGGPGAGGGHGGDGSDSKASGHEDGEGDGGGAAASPGAATGNGGGGGGACWGGGGGAADVDGIDGDASAGGSGGTSSGNGGDGGAITMSSTLVPLVSGSGGGGATSTLDGDPAGNGAAGGGGGLGLQISAKGTLTLDGDIDVSGGAGGDGWGGGGGGGSGGGVLLEAKHLFLNGSLYAEGGAGGDGDQGVSASGNGGGEGSHASPGGGGASANGGGGGGAAGVIYLRYLNSYTSGGTLSPSDGSGCTASASM